MKLRLTAAGIWALLPAMAFAQATVPPQPKGDRSTWITRSDYPKDEYFKGIQGTTVFVLTVDADGKVTHCDISQSSGSTVLDGITCDRLMTRAKFNPARDASGQKVQGLYHNRVSWTIPPEQKEEMDKARAAGEIGAK